MSDIEKWGDLQQYRAEPHGSYAGPESGVMPQVTLLWMTPDPLGAIGAMAAMYEGRVVRDLSELSHEDRVRYWHEMRKTSLNTPFESVSFHFLLEGVDRSFTHQLVRKRVGTAFAQESLRFAVPGDLSKATSLPPSLQGTDPDQADYPDQSQQWRSDWEHALSVLDRTYHRLVASGMPAEEARGLLPHATATRVHYLVNLRALLQEAGYRLCTQAQFHWKMVFGQMVKCIRDYWLRLHPGTVHERVFYKLEEEFNLIADAFRPVCYEVGHCPFKAGFDRDCKIRQRVDYFAKRGVPSSEWHEEYTEPTRWDDPLPWAKMRQTGKQPPNDREPAVDVIPAIRPEEWLLDPGAARKVR